MTPTVGVTRAMTNLNVAHRKLGLHLTTDQEFLGGMVGGFARVNRDGADNARSPKTTLMVLL
jgi:hypothetical protein